MLVAATAMALTLVSGPGAQAEPAGRTTAGAIATKEAAAARWHITGRWVGTRFGYGTVKMRFWRTDAGALAGSEHTLGVDCTWRLRFVKKVDGKLVFQEKTIDGGCGDFRIRLRKWDGGRLKVVSGWMFDEVLHRP